MKTQKNPDHEAICGAIVSWAQIYIDLLPNEKYDSRRNATFWTTLCNSKNPALRGMLPGELRDYFNEHGSNSEKNDFYDGQDAAIARVDQMLLSAKPPLEVLFKTIINDFALTGPMGMRVFDYIYAYPQIFGEVPALKIVYHYLEEAWQLTEKSSSVGNDDFGRELAHYLREKHGWDITPGRSVYLLKAWSDKQTRENFNALWRANKRGGSHKVQAVPLDPKHIVMVTDVREVFRAESEGRFRRPNQRQAAPRFYQSGELDHTRRKGPK